MCRMSKGPAGAEITLAEVETAKLEELARRHKTAQAVALRCRIVLKCARGLFHLGFGSDDAGTWRINNIQRILFARRIRCTDGDSCYREQ
jgi:hypothetical protein